MLLNHQYFRGFAPREIAVSCKVCEVLVAVLLDSREQVGGIGAARGCRWWHLQRAKGRGFICQHGFTDLEGHVWEVFVTSGNATEGVKLKNGH